MAVRDDYEHKHKLQKGDDERNKHCRMTLPFQLKIHYFFYGRRKKYFT